jgi:MFS family permease
MFVIGEASDRASRRFGTAGAAATMGAGALLFMPAVALIAIPSGAWLGVAGFYFLAIGCTTVASALALRIGPPERAGLMGALYGLVVNLAGQGLGPLLYGWLKDRRPGSDMGEVMATATTVIAVASCLALLVTARLSRRRMLPLSEVSTRAV